MLERMVMQRLHDVLPQPALRPGITARASLLKGEEDVVGKLLGQYPLPRHVEPRIPLQFTPALRGW